MAERAGSAIFVEPVRIDAKVLGRRHRDDGQGFVDLEKIDIADLPVAFVGHFVDRRDLSGRMPCRLLRAGRMRLDFGGD